MAYLRLLGHHFNPVYLKPDNLSNAISLLQASPDQTKKDKNRRTTKDQRDRRCGIDRRSQQQPVLLDTRSPHARRQRSRRVHLHRMSGEVTDIIGIDVYA